MNVCNSAKRQKQIRLIGACREHCMRSYFFFFFVIPQETTVNQTTKIKKNIYIHEKGLDYFRIY